MASIKHDRIWQALVGLYTALAVVAGVGAVTSEFGATAARLPQLASPAAASEHRPVAGAIAPSQLEAFIPLGRPAIRVPILEYHYVRVVTNRSDWLGFNLSVTPTDFSAQMDWLAAHDYHPVTFDDVRAYFAGKQPLPGRPVVLTFDDGYQNFWNVAEPILLAHSFKAVAYVVPGFWGQSPYMSPQEIVDLDQSGMVEIASHTMNHVNLVTASPANRAYQLGASMSTLERLLGHDVVDFCYPSGKVNAAAIAAVGAAGYQTATTEMPGITLTWATRLAWPRVYVRGGEKLATFVQYLGQPEPAETVLVAPSPVPTSQSGAS